MAAATLTKGPVGVAVPLLAWLVGRGALPAPRERTAPAAILVAVVLVRASRWAPGWPSSSVTNRPSSATPWSTRRFCASRRRGAFTAARPSISTSLTLAWALGPACAALVATTPGAPPPAASPDARGVGVRFAARVAAALIVLLHLSASKRPQYILPALVPLAILVAIGIANRPRRAADGLCGARRRRPGERSGAGGGGLLRAAPRGAERSAASASRAPDGGPGRSADGECSRSLHGSWDPGPRSPAPDFLPRRWVSSSSAPLTPWASMRSARTLATLIPPGATVVAFEAFRTSLPFYLRRSGAAIQHDGRGAHEQLHLCPAGAPARRC